MTTRRSAKAVFNVFRVHPWVEPHSSTWGQAPGRRGSSRLLRSVFLVTGPLMKEPQMIYLLIRWIKRRKQR